MRTLAHETCCNIGNDSDHTVAGLASQTQFTAFRDIEFRYPQASSLAKLLDSRATGSSFTVNGGGTQPVLDAMNKAIFEQKSQVMLQNATVNYVAAVKGQSGTARLLYKVDVKATIAGYVLQKETGNRSAIVDLDWRETLSSQSQDAQTIMSNPILDFGRFNLLLKS